MNQQFNQPTIQESKSLWPIIITVIITALVVGGGVWWWQRVVNQKTQQDLQEQITNLENQLNQLQQTEQKPEEDLYKDWKSYRNEKYGFEVRYPDNWKGGIEYEYTADQYCPSGMDCSWQVGKSVAFSPLHAHDFSVKISLLTQTNIEEAMAKSTPSSDECSNLTTTSENFLGFNTKISICTTRTSKWKKVTFKKNGTIFNLAGIIESDIPEEAFFNQILSTFKFIK